MRTAPLTATNSACLVGAKVTAVYEGFSWLQQDYYRYSRTRVTTARDGHEGLEASGSVVSLPYSVAKQAQIQACEAPACR